MKFRNLLLAGLAACTLASCSKDEAVDNGPKGPVDASISIMASSLKTKATEIGLSKENYVNTLTAYVFKEDGSYVNKKTLDYASAADYLKGDNGLIGIDHIIVKIAPKTDGQPSEDKFKLVLVANGKDLNVSSLTALQEAVITDEIGAYTVSNLTSGTPKYLPMASAVLTIGGLVQNVKTTASGTSYVENWINGGDLLKPVQKEGASDPTGIPANLNSIQLTRLIARAQVESLTVDIEGNYPGASFQLTSLSLVNVRSTATLNGGNGNYVKGYKSSGYEIADKWIDPTAVIVTSLGKNDYRKVLGADRESTISWTDTDVNKFFAYAFPNGVKPTGSTNVYETALLISGLFRRNVQDAGEVRNFRVFLQDPAAPEKGIQVLANNVYKLTVTITGEGSPNEDEILLNAHVGVKIEVNPWNVIEQNEPGAS